MSQLDKLCDLLKYDSTHCYKLIHGKLLVVLQRLPDTKTNEKRSGVVDLMTAKFRADKLKCIKIICTDTFEEIKESVNTYVLKQVTYSVGETVVPDHYDGDLDKVCAGGIHYFNSIEAAFYYRHMPDTWTGRWTLYYDSGEKASEENYSDGKKNGTATYWYANGHIKCEGEYKNGLMQGLWYGWYSNGEIEQMENYIDGVRTGEYCEWHINGKMSIHGHFLRGEKTGEWTYWTVCGTHIGAVDYSSY